MRTNLNISLIHYPVLNKHKQIITTSVTLFDIHDIARSCATFGVNEYIIVNPSVYQKKVVDRLVHFWMKGYGREYNENRAEAITKVKYHFTLEDSIRDLSNQYNQKILIVGTSAKKYTEYPSISFPELTITIKDQPVYLLFGTGWGLSEEVFSQCDYLLSPIPGKGDYNHLSVRAAAAIILYKIAHFDPE